MRLHNAAQTNVHVLTLIGVDLRWLGHLPPEAGFSYRIELNNVWRLLGFFDCPQRLALVRAYGVHLVPQDSFQVPGLELPPFRTEPGKALNYQTNVAIEAMLALGIPLDTAMMGFGAELSRYLTSD